MSYLTSIYNFVILCRLWRDVTLNLKAKNIEAATAGKHKLEQAQREGAKERKDTGTAWQTKVVFMFMLFK